MSEYVIQRQTLTGIADAIRAQLGTQQQYTPESMAAAIGSIQGSGTEIEDGLVTRKISGTYTNNRVLAIGDNAFKSCFGLTGVRFDNVISIGTASFSGCNAIETAYFPSVVTVENQGFFSNMKGRIYYFGAVKSIGSQAFINLGNSSELYELSCLIISTQSVCILKNINALQNFKGNIYVPEDLVDQYKVATNWATYADQFKGLSEIPADVQTWLDQQGGAST